MPRLSTVAAATDDEGHAERRPAGSVRRAAWIATALTLPIVVVLALLFSRGSDDAEDATTVAAPPDNPACAPLMAALPKTLADLAPHKVTPADDQVIAWGEPPMVLRCGVERPVDLVPASAAAVFYVSGTSAATDGVLWLPANREHAGENDPVVFTAIDRDVYIEVQLPRGQTVVPLPQLSDVIVASFPTPVCVAQTGDPTTTVPDDQLCTQRR